MLSVETYRFRRTSNGQPAYSAAIQLRAGGPTPQEVPLTTQERDTAAGLRSSAWEYALREVEELAKEKEALSKGGERWFDLLMLRNELNQVSPFQSLPPIHRLVRQASRVAPDSIEDVFYGYQESTETWRVNDRFLLGLLRAQEGDLNAMRRLIRLFMFHEALHVAHGITKARVEEVGKFPNALEHVDYAADLYAIVHELDRWQAREPIDVSDHRVLRERVAELIDVVVRSFWAFEPSSPDVLSRMEIRRIRRYLNWYWQRERVLASRSALQLVAVIGRKPIVEIAGLEIYAESRRVFASLTRFDRRVGLELGIVLDNEELRRVASSVNVPIAQLVSAFRVRNHEGIKAFMSRVLAEVGEHGLPTGM
jgi:hypothetical protein